MDTLNNEIKRESPVTVPEPPAFRKKVGKTTYLVRIHFNPESKETLQDKLERMLVNEVNRPDPAA